ncbi:MAG: glycosyltransferase, partial [Candidatus Aminicenantes bacterium]|nr:glycosyltransferase [Candidatus Aminicenantes bacterium]
NMKKNNPQIGKKIKILFFLDSLRAGGKERQAVELLKQLSAKQDFKFELLLMKKGIHYKEVNDLNIKINYLYRRNIFDISVFFKLFKILKKIEPSILHTWSTITALYAGPVARLLKIKNICGSVRGATNVKTHFKSRLINKTGFLFADKIIANSYAGILSRNLKDSKKAMCIHNGFDFSRIRNLEKHKDIREKFSIKSDKIIGMVGSLDDRKDNEIFINAAKQILKKRRDVTFLVVGDGPKLEYLKSLVEKKDRGHIIFTGRQDEIESIVNIFDIGVLTSKNEFFREGISNSIMEYMALEKSVIATDSGGNSEIVEDKITGFLVRPKDLDALLGKIDYLLDNPGIAEKMGKAGRVRIEKEFNIEKMINSFIELYKGLF